MVQQLNYIEGLSMSEEKGFWGLVGRLNSLMVLVGAIGAAITGVIAFLSGLNLGEAKQRAETQENIEKLSAAVPESQRSRTAPVFAAMKAAASSNEPASESRIEFGRLAQNISNAVVGIPASIFSIGTSRVFSVPEQKTALVCNDRYHVGYGGPVYGSANETLIILDEEKWVTQPGNTKLFQSGIKLTLMGIENRFATLDIQCKE